VFSKGEGKYLLILLLQCKIHELPDIVLNGVDALLEDKGVAAGHIKRRSLEDIAVFRAPEIDQKKESDSDRQDIKCLHGEDPCTDCPKTLSFRNASFLPLVGSGSGK